MINIIIVNQYIIYYQIKSDNILYPLFGLTQYLYENENKNEQTTYLSSLIINNIRYLFVNTSSSHGSAIGLNQLNQGELRKYNSINNIINDNIIHNITVKGGVLPLTTTQQKIIEKNGIYIPALLIIVALAFGPAYSSVFIIREREVYLYYLQNNVKHQLLLSDINIYSYWISILFFDMIIYIIPYIIIFQCYCSNIMYGIL